MIASPTYRIFEQAMEERRLVVCLYHGLRRELMPVILGWSDGPEKVLAYQLGGASSQPLTTPTTRWRCLLLADVSVPELKDGWLDLDTSHAQPQSCVKDVDLDLNPQSPFHPRRKLSWQS